MAQFYKVSSSVPRRDGLNLRHKLAIAQMALDGTSAATIEFFTKAIPFLTIGTSLQVISEHTYISKRGAIKHLNVLKEKGIVNHARRSSWTLVSELPIRDPDLLKVVNFA